MRKLWMIAGVLALAALFCGSALVRAEASSRVTPVEAEEKPLKPEDLKIDAGKTEGFKTPTEVFNRAVKLSKGFKVDDAKSKEALIACFYSEAHAALDQVDYSYIGDKERTELEAIANFLLTVDSAKAQEMKQSSYGNLAVIQVPSEKGIHMIRTVINKGDWKLTSGYIYDYTLSYSSGMDEFKKALSSGNGAEVKKYIGEYDNSQLELLSGAVDGVDPYDLLAKKIKKMMGTDIKPIWMLQSSGSEVALWFHSDKSDATINFSYTQVWNNKTNSSDYVPRLAIRDMADLNKDFATLMRSWNHFTDWSSQDGGKDGDKDSDEKDEKDGAEKDAKTPEKDMK